MGVDFYTCNYCSSTFPDCGWYVKCGEDCWTKWCSDECSRKEGYRTYYEDDDDSKERSCKWCRTEDLDDSVLVEFLLKQCKLTRKKAIAAWKKKNKIK